MSSDDVVPALLSIGNSVTVLLGSVVLVVFISKGAETLFNKWAGLKDERSPVDESTLLVLKKEVELKNELLAEKDKLLAEKEKRITETAAEKEQRIRDKVKMIQMKDDAYANLEKDLLLVEAKYCSILSNRVVIECGLRQYFKDKNKDKGKENFTLGAALKFFCNSEVFNKTKHIDEHKLTEAAKTMLKSGAEDPRNVEKTLKTGLVHALSVPHHHMQHGQGLCIGGDEPLRAAVALVTFHLSKLGYVNEDIGVVQRNYKREFEIQAGGIVVDKREVPHS